jgi:ubiquitin C-terminal hydrolase
MKGFKNIGNTCYLNSGLQMLVQNSDLCQLITDYSSKSQILSKIAEFIKNYYNENSSNIVVPIEIKKIVENKKELFGGFQQQDSTEFIIYLLDIIDEEIKKINKESNGIQPIFGIKFSVRIKCKLRDCLKIYNREETNNFLLLDIESDYTHLNDAYRNFKSGTRLDADNKYYCENCKAKRIASKRHNIDIWPKYLFVWLKRFKQDGKRFMKNNQDIEIPIEWRHNNHLQGAVIHYGNLNGGHYVYVGKQNDKWFLFNDSSVSEINSEAELKNLLSKAYWLCYKQIT